VLPSTIATLTPPEWKLEDVVAEPVSFMEMALKLPLVWLQLLEFGGMTCVYRDVE
jgi:hypothetical protein